MVDCASALLFFAPFFANFPLGLPLALPLESCSLLRRQQSDASGGNGPSSNGSFR